MSDKRLIIFAGNYAQALQCAQERGTPPCRFTFAADRWRLAGLNRDDFDYITHGTWKQNEEVVEAFEYWMTRPSSALGKEVKP